MDREFAPNVGIDVSWIGLEKLLVSFVHVTLGDSLGPCLDRTPSCFRMMWKKTDFDFYGF